MFQSDHEEFYHLHRVKLQADFSTALELHIELKELFYNPEPEFGYSINTLLIRLMTERLPAILRPHLENVLYAAG